MIVRCCFGGAVNKNSAPVQGQTVACGQRAARCVGEMQHARTERADESARCSVRTLSGPLCWRDAACAH